MAKEISVEIKNPKIWFLLAIVLIVAYIEMQLTFNAPIAFGDEPFHVYMGKYIGENIEYPKYIPAAETGTQKPGFHRSPVWNLIQGALYVMFGFNESIVMFLIPVIASLTALALYLLFKKIFNENIALMASIMMLTVPSFVTYSVMFYADLPYVFFLVMAVGTTMLMFKTKQMKYAILSGIFSSIAIHTKTPALTLGPFLLLCFLYQLFTEKKLMETLRLYGVIALILALMIGPFVLRTWVLYQNAYCSMTMFIPIFGKGHCTWQVPYEEQHIFSGDVQRTGQAAEMVKLGLANFIELSYGVLWFVPLLAFAGLHIMLKSKKSIYMPIIFILLGFVIVLSKIMSGRAEDANRYLLGVVPMASLMAGIYLDSVVDFVRQHRERYAKYVAVAFIVLMLYPSYINLKTKMATMTTVKQFSPMFFEMCDYVRENLPEDASLFILYAGPAIYNCERDSAWEVMDKADILLNENVTNMLERLEFNGFTHIIVQKFAISQVAYSQSYPLTFVYFLESHPDSFKNIVEDGLPLQQCAQVGGCDGYIIYEIDYSLLSAD